MPWNKLDTPDNCPNCGRKRHSVYSTPSGANTRKTRGCRACDGEPTNRKPTPKEEKMPETTTPQPEADGKTPILNSCGHTYRYKIRRDSAIDWLKRQPCPPCKRKGVPSIPDDQPLPDAKSEPTPEPEPEPTPEPQPEREVDQAWVDEVADMLPGGLFHSVLPDVIRIVREGIPVWLQGPMGTTKSTIGQQVAAALGLSFYPMRCHELMSESQLFGYVFGDKEHRSPLWDGYEKGGVVLIDEIDNGNANLLAALNGALSNKQCVFGGEFIVDMHPDFRLIASANTAGLGPEHGFIGRNGVDNATRDRFVTVQCPIDEQLEEALAELYLGESTVEDLEGLFAERAIAALAVASSAREELTGRQITTAVRALRQAVASRFTGITVSPRTTIHAAQMVRAGFTLREAFSAKLPGLKPVEIEDLLSQVLGKEF